MFRFIDKTADEFRDEIFACIGSTVKTQCGTSVIISEVSQPEKIVTSVSNFERPKYNSKGELYWGSVSRPIEHYGFFVSVQTPPDERGCYTTYTELISIPYEYKDQKHCVKKQDEKSILEK